MKQQVGKMNDLSNRSYSVLVFWVASVVRTRIEENVNERLGGNLHVYIDHDLAGWDKHKEFLNSIPEADFHKFMDGLIGHVTRLVDPTTQILNEFQCPAHIKISISVPVQREKVEQPTYQKPHSETSPYDVNAKLAIDEPIIDKILNRTWKVVLILSGIIGLIYMVVK